MAHDGYLRIEGADAVSQARVEFGGEVGHVLRALTVLGKHLDVPLGGLMVVIEWEWGLGQR